MKKLLLLPLALLAYLSVSATIPLVPLYTVRFLVAHDLAVGDVVVEDGKEIGRVREVRLGPGGGLEVAVEVKPSFQERVRQRSTFVVRRLPGRSRPVLSLEVLDEQSPPLASGGILEGADSEVELALRREMVRAEKALRGAAREVDRLQRTLEDLRTSPERKELESSFARFLQTLQRFQKELEKMVAEELSKLKKWYEKPPPPPPEPERL